MDTTQLKQCEFCGITSASPCDTHDKSSACPIYLARADKLKGTQAITDTTTPGAPLPQEALAAVLQQPVAPAAPVAPEAPHPATITTISGIGAAAVHAALHGAEPAAAVEVAAVKQAAPAAATAALDAIVTKGFDTSGKGDYVEGPPVHYAPAHPQVIADADTAMDPTNPAYYSRFKIQPIVFIRENNLPFWAANVVKYVARADAKNGREDIAKALDYLTKELAYLDGDPNWHLATAASSSAPVAA